MTRQKNEVAKMLLELGASLGEIAQFTEKLLNSAGTPAVNACMKGKDTPTRMSNLRKLASALNIQMPAVKMDGPDVKKTISKKLTK